MSISTFRRDHGFSFIELLAYMAIAALLILAAVPQFNQYRQKAAISNLQSDLRGAATDMEAVWQDAQAYPRTLPPTIKVSRGTTLTIDRLVTDADKMDALITACRAYGWSCTWQSEGSTLVLSYRTSKGFSNAWLPVGTEFRAIDNDPTAITGFTTILSNAGLPAAFTLRDYAGAGGDQYCISGTNTAAASATWHFSSTEGRVASGGC